MKRGIFEDEPAYSLRTEDHLSSKNNTQVWRRIQHITGYKSGNLSATEGNALLAKELKLFFAHFEAFSAALHHPHQSEAPTHL